MTVDSNWLWFRRDEPTTVAEWESTTGAALGRVLGLGHALKISLKLPSVEKAAAAWRDNLDLLGEIRIAELHGDAGERLKIHLPIDGVFIASGNTNNRPQSKVWDSWLGEKPGVRRIRPIGKRADEENVGWWRIGFPDGSHLEFRGEKESSTDVEDAESPKRQAAFSRRVKFALAMCADAYPEGLQKEFEKPNVSEKSVCAWCRAYFESDGDGAAEEVTDRDDLKYRPLITFPVWLRQRLCRRFWNERQAFERQKAGGKRVESEFDWKEQDLLQRVACGLVPLRESVGKRKKLTGLSALDAENPLELISRMSGVKRFRVNRDDALTYSADYRQNHKSFDGRLCPIESPESEMVGISLQLARGARAQADGMIVPTSSEKVVDRVGWGVAMIPFSHHNDGARNMMGAKNLRQLLPVHGAECPRVRTGVEDELLRLTANLSGIGICPKCADAEGHFAAGVDLLVAYMPWYGWNVDDAVVVSDSIVAKMTVTKRKTFSRFVTPGWDVEVGDLAAGDLIAQGDVIATLKGPDGETVELKYLDVDRARMVKSPSFPPKSVRSNSVSYRLEYTIEKDFPLGPGDKLMGRHGNKGVISRVEPYNMMPRLPKDGEPGAEVLPKRMRGRHVDILLNPHGVISRMNPSQLLETHLGWLIRNGIEETSEFFKSDGNAVGVPEVGPIDHDKVMTLLKESGLDNTGKIKLHFNDGSTTEQPIVVGYQHFVRLNHIPSLKAQARRGGVGASYSMSTGQAKHGKRVGGGQRLGEMEVWALAAHQADAVLEEMLGPKSDMALACAWNDADQTPRGKLEDGFPSVMRDWLRAMMIDFSVDVKDKTVSAAVLSDASAGMDASQEVRTDGGVDVWKTAEFGCKGEGRAVCEHCIARHLSARRLLMSKDGVRCGLTLGALFAGYGVCLGEFLADEGDERYSLPIRNAATLQSCGKLKLEMLGRNKTSITFQLSLDDAIISGFPDAVKTIFAYLHWNSKDTLDDKIHKLMSGKDSLGEFYVSCPHVKSKTIDVKDGTRFGERIVAERGGLYDEHIFGPFGSPASDSAHDQWGWIKIPDGAMVNFPIWMFRSEKADKGILKKIAAGDSGELIPIRSIPVLPLRYRYPSRVAGGFRFNKIDTEGYQQILLAIKAYERADPESRNVDALQIAVSRLVDLLLKEFSGKEGLLRHYGLGRRVDRSMRMVITPNPVMKYDEVRAPFAILWEVMGDLVCKEMKRPDLLESARMNGIGWSWPRSENDLKKSEGRKQLLREYLKAHENGNDPIYLLLNRQPSLHRDSFQAFRVGLLEEEFGNAEVFQISPLCCKGFAADFDGDEMVGHLPVSKKAREAAKKMSPIETALSAGMVLVGGDKDSEIYGALPLANFDRDFVSGEYLRNPQSNSSGNDFKTRILKSWIDDPSWCLKLKYGEDFDLVTKNGLSFGYYDLYNLQKKFGDKRHDGVSVWQVGPLDNKSAIEIIVKTGANGTKQIGKLIDCRGQVKEKDCSKEINASLIDGMTWEDIFVASWNARTTMCNKKLGTGKAGDLTRKLVLALWGILIGEESCPLSDEERADGMSILRCRSTNGLCMACYNKIKPHGLPDVKKGYPAGLMAALSLGERGTQLSMKGAHTSRVEVDIDDVKSLLLKGQFPESKGRDDENLDLKKDEIIEGWPLFLKAIAGSADECFSPYHEVDERHLQLVWRALHMLPSSNARKQELSDRDEKLCKLHPLSKLYSAVLLTKLAASRQKGAIERLIKEGASVIDSPIGKILFNILRSRQGEIGE